MATALLDELDVELDAELSNLINENNESYETVVPAAGSGALSNLTALYQKHISPKLAPQFRAENYSDGTNKWFRRAPIAQVPIAALAVLGLFLPLFSITENGHTMSIGIISPMWAMGSCIGRGNSDPSNFTRLVDRPVVNWARCGNSRNEFDPVSRLLGSNNLRCY